MSCIRLTLCITTIFHIILWCKSQEIREKKIWIFSFEISIEKFSVSKTSINRFNVKLMFFRHFIFPLKKSEIRNAKSHKFPINFFRGGNKKVNGNNNGNKPSTQQRRQSNIDEIPADVGKLRDNRKVSWNEIFGIMGFSERISAVSRLFLMVFWCENQFFKADLCVY